MNTKNWSQGLPTWGFVPASALQASRQREQALLTALQASGGGRWEWDVSQRKLSFYGDFYARYGLLALPASERTAHWSSLVHPEDRSCIAESRHRTINGLSDGYEAEFRVRDLSGHWRCVIARGNITERDENGKVLHLVGISLDITARRAAENALLTSQAKYNTIYQALPDPAGISRLSDGLLMEVNPAFCQLFGYAREQVVGQTSEQLNIWANTPERHRVLRAYLRKGLVKKMPLVARAKVGALIPGLMSAYPVPIDGEDCFVFVFHDMTHEQQINDKLNASNSLLQQAGQLARLGVWEDQPGKGPVYWSDVCYKIHGMVPGTPLPRDYVQRHVAPQWHEAFRNAMRSSIRQHLEWNLEIEIIDAKGRFVWVRTLGEPVIEEGRVVKIRGVMQDIDASKRAEERVREREALLSLTIEAASLGLWDWDLVLGTIKADANWLAMRGITPEMHDSALPVPWMANMVSDDIPKINQELQRHAEHPKTHFDVTCRIAHPHDGDRWVRNLGKTVVRNADGAPVRMLGISMDVTRQREQEQQLHQLAHHDALTGLPNRILLARRLADAISQTHELGTILGVAYLDLDGFKPINDIHGHDAGDRLLAMAAGRLTRSVRASDCVARLGGDEFVILLPGLHKGIDCERALRFVIEGIAAPYNLGSDCPTVRVTASIGFTLYPQDNSDADTLLRHADQAMYLAKQGGRNRFHQFDVALARVAEQAEAQAQAEKLQVVLVDGQFVLSPHARKTAAATPEPK